MDTATLQTGDSSREAAANLAQPPSVPASKTETESHLAKDHVRGAFSDTSAPHETRHNDDADVPTEPADDLSLSKSHCPPVRVIFAVAALVLTAALLVDVGMVCSDLGEYGPRSDSNDDNPRKWLPWFVLVLLECVLMIVFLLRELWRGVGRALAKNGEGSSQLPPLSDAMTLALRKKSTAWKVALLEAFAFVTVVLYMYTFINSAYGLHHLALHLKFVSVSLSRVIAFSIFALAELW